MQYKVTEAQLLAFHRLTTRKAFVFCSALCGGYLLFVLTLIAFAGSDALLLGLAIAAGVLLFLMVISRYVITPRQVSTIYREDRQIQEPTTITFHQDGYTAQSASGLNSRKWANMVKWDEDGDIFVVYSTRQLGHIFPKDQVPQDVIDEIRGRLIASGLGEKGKLRK